MSEPDECCNFPVYGSGVLTANGIREGFVDAGSLVCFNSKVYRQHIDDVLESTLIAQLAANKKYDRFTDSHHWYKAYSETISQVGWLTQRFVSFSEYIPLPDVFKISDVVIKIFSQMFVDEEEMVKIVKDAIDKLEQSKAKEGLSLFGSNSTSESEKNGNFQILSCSVDKSNQVSVAFLGFYFNSKKTTRNFFFEKMKKSDVHLFKSEQIFTLNEDQYSQLREEVKKKLGERTKNYVKNLQIE